MFDMEKLSKGVASKIAVELNLDNDNKEVIAYGAFAILHMLLCIMLAIVFGALFGVLVETLIISFIVSILRKYSGGVHASTPGICAAIGTIVSVGLGKVALIISYFLSLKFLLVLGIITFIVAYYIVYKLAPVDSPAKPIKKIEKIKRMKKGSMIILSFYLLFVVLNIILFITSRNRSFVICSLCIYVGVLWQVLTLTYSGSVLFTYLDSFFNHIQTYIGRGI